MPVNFLTDAERTRLNNFPVVVEENDLSAFFTLTDADLNQVRDQRGDSNRLGFALQLGALRYLGFCPDDLKAVPDVVVHYLARQLNVAAATLQTYAERPQTRTGHLLKVQAYLGFREAGPLDFHTLTQWLVERALEHDKPTLLFQWAAQKLQREKIVRPGVTRLERLVASAREQAQQETFLRLTPLLTTERRMLLDQLLVRDETLGRTRLDWFRQGATSSTPRAILGTLDKLTLLQKWAVADWNLTALTPNRLKFLARLGQKSTPQALQRTPEERRYPILLAFLVQAQCDLTDETIDLYDNYLTQAYSRAERDLAEFRQSMARTTNEKIRLFQAITRIVLDPTVTDQEVRAAIYQQMSPSILQQALEECRSLMRPLDGNYFDFLARRYSVLRSFAPQFLNAFTFHSNTAAVGLWEAIALLRQLNATGKRKVPAGAPFAFVTTKWRPYVTPAEGETQISFDRRYYEMCVLWELRGALRAGNIWVQGSRRYADPESYLIPRDRWPELRPEVCQLLQIPAAESAGIERLAQRQSELEDRLNRLDRSWSHHAHLRIDAGKLVLSPLKAEELPARCAQLQQRITERLPRIELADLLIEVDGWTGFSRHFEHATGREARNGEMQTHLYAALLAQACNLGLTAMAEISDISYRRLAWCTTWYLREETLRPAMATIVNYHARQSLSSQWGGGTLSSSDGQRFPAAVATRHAKALPRYFGYGRGLTFYTWTSDQFSQYGTKVIPSTVRDATYVLDEILDNETELPIREHTTDTAGYTELVFALFDLLGLQFAPRIRDLGDQRLYRLDGGQTCLHLEPLLKGKLKREMILHHWDDLLRVAGSLKMGWVTASLLVGKLQSFPRQNALLCALQEYGRLIKTIFILRYLENEEYRRRIGLQLNKGESLHALRRFLFFAREGHIRQRHSEGQANQASCLNIVTNAVITWNTIYMMAAVEQLRAEGYTVEDADLAHLSPARYEHINPYGKYRFNLEEGNRPQLRPLRQPAIEKA